MNYKKILEMKQMAYLLFGRLSYVGFDAQSQEELPELHERVEDVYGDREDDCGVVLR